MYNLKETTRKHPMKNMVLITVFYQLILVIGYPILLIGFKIGDGVLDKSGLGSIFIGHGAHVDFILYNIHEC